MCLNEFREPAKTMSIMVWQSNPQPRGYLTIEELDDLIITFLVSAKQEPE